MAKSEKYLDDLKQIFINAKDKHEANYRSNQVLADMSGDPEFFRDSLKWHLQKKGSLNTLHYPTVGLDIEVNEYFTLVANCWIPLPDRATDISTKAIHHHGDMLLTTVTAFGTGYEHWMFETPAVVDADKEIYQLKVLEHAPHPRHHVAFVDAYIAHLPLYPPDLTVTYALWSSRFPTTWKDRLKRMPLLQQNAKRLRAAGVKVGLAKQLELKVVEYFDFYPTCDGFRGIRERREFERSTNEDYLAGLFHVIQGTGNENLAPVIREKLSSNEKIDNRKMVEDLTRDLESGKRIEPGFSTKHYGIEGANFTRDELLAAIDRQDAVLR